MSRSVSTHSNAVATVYITPEIDECNGWTDFIDDLRDNVLKPAYPSLRECNDWEGRENHVIVRNHRCEISVSEYCGLVAICLAPLTGYQDEALNAAWTRLLAPSFVRKLNQAYAHCALQSQGHASNGEQFFTRVGKPGSCVTSKEGDLW